MIATPQERSVITYEISRLAPGSLRATGLPMPVFLLCVFLGTAASLAAGQGFTRDVTETNVNQRYSIESVSLGGVGLDDTEAAKLPPTLRERLSALIGQKCDMGTLADLSAEIRRELHFRTVTERLLKGNAPDMVKVDFEVVQGEVAFEVTVPRLLFTSDQKVTGELDANIGFRQNHFTLGAVSNGDDLIERFNGMMLRFDSAPLLSTALGNDRFHASVTFEDYHTQWNAATLAADEGANVLYRSRWSVSPQLTFAIARPITIAVGTSFAQMEPASGQAGNRSANAGTFDIRYGRKIEGGSVQQRIEGKYSLRVATRALGSTYAYARHMISFRYEARSGRHMVSDTLSAGAIAGDAPLFERFALGTSSVLPGWNRFQIEPVGGTRIAHNEVSYGYRVGPGTVETFYDMGTVWQAGEQAILRHAAGVGYRQGIFVLTTAFPIRNGRVEPVFMAGMNY